MIGDIRKIPNLVSLGRLLFLIPVAYFLSQPGSVNRIYALICLGAAAASDFLDGFLARKLNQKTQLGLVLDPLADKILAAVLGLLLIIHRDFPVALAAAIIGRDLLILAGGVIVRKRTETIPASNLTGKYCFASIALLLVWYVAEFPFGIRLFTILVLTLMPLSLVMYGLALRHILAGNPPPVFADQPLYRWLRITAIVLVAAWCLYHLAEYMELM